MLWIAAKFVLCLLIEEQKENYVSTCQDIQERLERDAEFIVKVITGDEM
jgi:hypothetical protein